MINIINAFFNITIPFCINCNDEEIVNLFYIVAVCIKHDGIYEYPEKRYKMKMSNSLLPVLDKIDQNNQIELILTDNKYLKFGHSALKCKFNLKIQKPKYEISKDNKFVTLRGEKVLIDIMRI